MKTLFTLIGKDFRIFWNDRIAVVMTFVVPMVLMTIFGMIFGGFGDGGMSGVRVMVIDQAGTEASRTMIEALEAEEGLNLVTHYRDGEGEDAPLRPLTEEIARQRLTENASYWRFALIFPENFEKEDFGFRLRYLYNPRSSVEAQIVTGLLQRTFFANAFPLLQERMTGEFAAEYGPERIGEFQDGIAKIISGSFDVSYEDARSVFPEGSLFPDFSAIENVSAGEDDTADTAVAEESTADPFSFLLDLEDEQIAGKGKPPAAQSVGAWAVMFLLFTMTGAASALFEERDQGVFHRLLSGPVSRMHILWSKYVFLALLGLVQLTILMAFGQAVFNVITSVNQLLPLAVICVAGAAASTAFGMILCSFCKTPAQANGMGTLFILSMSALGGAMVPSFMFPAFIREYLSPFTLVHWMLDGMLKVLWEDATVAGLWLNLVVLGAFAVLALIVAQWRFRRGDLFR